MAPLLALWMLLGSAFAVQIPEVTRPVTDLANVLDASEEEAIARQLIEHREATGVQLAVLVVLTTHGEDIADYAQRVFAAWGGGSAERDDGALFVLAIMDRRSRLHLGYGLEPLIPDSVARQMLDGLSSRLRAEDYGGATRQLVAQVRTRTSHLRPGEPIGVPLGANAWLWLVVMLVGVAAGIAWGIVLGRRPNAEPDGADVFKAVWIAVAVLASVQVLLVVLFFTGRGFWLVYSSIFWVSCVVGWVIVGAPRRLGVPLAIATVLAFLVGISQAEIGLVVPDGGAVLSEASYTLGAFCIFFLIGIFLSRTAPFQSFEELEEELSSSGVSTRSTSSSRSYSSYSSYSSDDSSFSSGGSSFSSGGSSFSSGGSSFSSRSYSGGGGSSGGGGASSSW